MLKFLGSDGAYHGVNLPFFDTTDFGADPTGFADSTTAIQNAINAVPSSGGASGGIVYLPGIQKISSPLIIGNSGVYLLGGGDLQSGQSQLVWGGASSNASMLVFEGTLKGWGVSNILFNGNNNVGGALKLIAASNGESKHCATVNFTSQHLILNSLVSAISGNPNCQFNTFNDWQFFLSNVASTMAFLLDGNGTNNSTNTSENTFDNFAVIFPNVNTAMFGGYLRDCDSNEFHTLIMAGGGSGTLPLTFDYGGVSGGDWPANNSFISYDPDGLSPSVVNKYFNSGTPNSLARPNRFDDVHDTNGNTTYPKIANTSYDPEIVNPGVNLIAQTGAISATNINPIPLYVTGMYRVSPYLEITTTGIGGGTVSVTIGWTDDSGQAQSATSSAIATGAKNYAQLPVIMRAQLGSNITFSTTVNGAMGAAQYALFIKLEKMD